MSEKRRHRLAYSGPAPRSFCLLLIEGKDQKEINNFLKSLISDQIPRAQKWPKYSRIRRRLKARSHRPFRIPQVRTFFYFGTMSKLFLCGILGAVQVQGRGNQNQEPTRIETTSCLPLSLCIQSLLGVSVIDSILTLLLPRMRQPGKSLSTLKPDDQLLSVGILLSLKQLVPINVAVLYLFRLCTVSVSASLLLL
jgi:hypothetical protein